MLPDGVRDLLKPRFVRNGQPGFVGGVVDSNRDGIPDYVYSVMQTEIPARYGIPRSSVTANPAAHRPADPSGFAFWPLLAGPHSVKGQRYFDTWPQISVDWKSGRVVGGMGLSGHPIEAGYHINSISQWQSGQVNDAAFENPMAYYNLAGNHDGNPDLHVRVEYAPPGDRYWGGGTQDAAEDVRYSWNQTNAPGISWDYKFGLAGRHRIDTVETFGPYNVRVVPYNELPR